MIQTKEKLRFVSFEEYLAYDDGTNKLYELFNGELVEVPPESGDNVEIAAELFCDFLSIVGRRRIRYHGLEIEVQGEPKNRYPDLTILREEHVALLSKRNTIRLTMPPPLLVVEVVSPGNLQRERDYVAKRRQYEDIGIGEYWIVDPDLEKITVLAIGEDSRYQEVGVFQNRQQVVSPTFPTLKLSAKDVLTAKNNPETPEKQ
ncbi:MAG: Uma2 family endonuclease [Cyanobacteria bacterium J06627_28]